MASRLSNGLSDSFREFSRICNDLSEHLENFIHVLFHDKVPAPISKSKGVLESELGERMAVLEFREPHDVTHLGMTATEINVNTKIFPCVMTEVAPEVIYFDQSKFL